MSTRRDEVDFYLPLYDPETGDVDPEAWYERGLLAEARDFGLGIPDWIAADILGSLPKLEGTSATELPDEVRQDLLTLARLIEQVNDEDPATTEAVEQAFKAVSQKIDTL